MEEKTLMNKILAEEFGDCFLNGQFSDIYHQSTDEFKNTVTLKQFIDYAKDFNTEVKKYSLEMITGLKEDISLYFWLDNNRQKAMSVFFDGNGIIYGVNLAPFVTYPESDRTYTKNTYIMPIKEEWFVFWGRINQFINYHYVYEDQKYAYDLIILKDGSAYKDSPDNNENYFAFNKEIVAPANGKVIKVRDGIKDNQPGEMNPEQPEGNCVIIEHLNNEYII